MASFTKSIVIDAPVEAVFGVHERPNALELLTPPFPPVRVVGKTGGLEPGSRVELRVGFLDWIAVHTQYQRNQLFVDEQVRGPFAKWVHRHEFEDLGTQTRLTDRVEFILPGGSLINAALGWVVKIGLGQMFRHRHATTKQLCEED
jgi:ligand-binding SRPBCC domain-containing protein